MLGHLFVFCMTFKKKKKDQKTWHEISEYTIFKSQSISIMIGLTNLTLVRLYTFAPIMAVCCSDVCNDVISFSDYTHSSSVIEVILYLM